MGKFVHLHNHTEYSLLDGCSHINNLVEKAKNLGMEALAITDHGNMFGAVKFFNECKAQGIKPIIGCEVYTAERTMADRDKEIGHLVLLAKNDIGYKNLITIVSNAYTEGFYYKPRTDKEELRKHSEGLVALSGCLAGKTQQLILHDKYEEAKQEALELYDIFGEGNFYLELQDHGSKEDKIVVPALIKMSRETGIPVVATNDCHYIEREDSKAQEVLLCLQTNTTISNPKFTFDSDSFYLKSEEEMTKLFGNVKGAIENTKVIADMCNFEFEFGNYRIPSFDVPAPFKDTNEYFRFLCEEGFRKKCPDTPEYHERLEYEITTIENMGYIEYFLIVADFVNYAKTHNTPVGPGRGSAAGSIVAYVLGITEVDPIKYSLFFERFLNPERVSMPDIDIDFCIRNRGKVIQYVTEKYGPAQVCQITTLGTMKAKMAIRDVSRAMELPYAEANALAKMVPEEAESLQDALDTDPDFLEVYNSDPQKKAVIDMALKLENVPRHSSTHAAGVVISAGPVKDFIPLLSNSKGIATQYNMTEIESLGALKMDFLGLRNLTAINDALDLIEKNHGVRPKLEELDLNDPEVFKYISKGKTVGIFQLESEGITNFMKRLKPSCFEDIIAGVALYRPGPMDSIDTYIDYKRHPNKIKYLDPKLKPILDVTYGITVFQEQVMSIVRDLAGYSFGRADLVRRAMSKKKQAVMMEEKEYFINGKLDKDGNVEIPGCVRNGISAEVAAEIYDGLINFAQYAFNKSHATAYAMITYQTAWLKKYYPAEFMAALMTSEMEKPDHMAVFIRDARKIINPHTGKRIKVLPPHVQKSNSGFTVNEDGNIVFGLNAIKNVGENVAIDIQNARERGADFSGLYPFLMSLEKKSINKKVVEALISCGALNGMIPNINSGLYASEEAIKNARKRNNLISANQISLFDIMGDTAVAPYPVIETFPEYPKEQLLAFEKEYLGTYITGHPMKKYASYVSVHTTASAKDIADGKLVKRKVYILAGMISECKIKFTKNGGKKMAFLTIDDEKDDSFKVIVFPKTFENVFPMCREGEIVAVKGRIDDEGTIIADDIAPIENIEALEARNQYTEEKKQTHILKFVGTEAQAYKVLEIAQKYDGDYPVYWYRKDTGKCSKANVSVRMDTRMYLEISDIVGKENVKWA